MEAEDDDVHQGSAGRTTTVTATVANDRAAADATTMAVTGAALALTDDEAPPGATLSLNPATVAESGAGNTSAVSATLSRASAVATTVTVTAVSGFYTVGPDATIVIAAGATTAATDTAAITAVDDAIHQGSAGRTATVTGSMANDRGAGPVTGATLTITDDETLPVATLVLSRASIAEAGGVATVTARLSGRSSAAVTITVSASPGAGTDFTQSGTTLTVAAGATASTGAVTAVDNDVDAPDKSVTVSGTASDSLGLANAPSPVTLAIADDDEKGLVLDPEEVTAAEGGTVEYTVALNSEPTGSVAVTVASDHADVTVSHASLTFTPMSWATAQTVTVTAAADGDDSADTVTTVSHRASGGGYDGEAGTVEVSVSGDTKVEVRDVAGTRRYRIEGRRVDVRVEAGVPDGIEVDFAGVGAGPAMTLTFRPWPAARVAEAAGGYGLGPVGSRVVVEVVASGVPAGGVRLCLPVGEGLRTARAVASFSPFAVGYLDEKPEFDFSIASRMVFTVDEAIVPVTLPAATGGDFPMGEALGPSTLAPETLPPGLDFDRDSSGRCGSARTLCGTPTEEFAQRRYTWTTDEDADGQSDVLPFTIEVVPARAQARSRLKALNASVLPEVARASWGSWTEAVSGRLGSSSRGGGGAGEGAAAALAGFVQANEQALEEGASWKELLSGRSFAVALGGEEGEDAGAGTGLGRPVTVWGAVDRRSLSRDVPALKWSGNLFAAHLGADAELGSGVTGGVGVSWFESRVDYVDRSGEDGPVEGKHRTRMASVQPYLGWSWEGGARLWGSVGYGTGEVEIEDKDLVERFGRQRSDSRLLAAAAGGSVRLVSEGALRLDLKGEGQMTRYVVDDNGDLMAGLSVQTQRVRVSAQGTREYALDGGGRVSPSGELGVRWDGGDGATGAGVEVGAGVSWSGAGRVKVEVGGRWLVAHRSGLEEWGLSGGVRVEPEADGRGLSLSVAPGWGETGSGAARLWEEGMAGRGETAEVRSGAVLEAELGYGVGAFGGFGVATPYTRLGLAQEERRYGVGWRLSRWPGEAFALDLEASRRERETARPEHGVGLELRLRW